MDAGDRRNHVIIRTSLIGICAFNTRNEAADALREAREAEGLTCLIAGSRKSQEKLAALLGDDAPPVIRRNMSLPAGGPVLMELPLVKGLEFDAVILPDADPEEYPDSLIGRHRLYTAISRATRKVTVFALDTMTALLQGRKSGE